jgi:hypothetical protein
VGSWVFHHIYWREGGRKGRRAVGKRKRGMERWRDRAREGDGEMLRRVRERAGERKREREGG